MFPLPHLPSATQVLMSNKMTLLKSNTWRREWQLTPVFLPGEFHGERSLVGYRPWDCKESDMTERLTHTHTHTHTHTVITTGFLHLIA